jgi:hypothetical protein
MNLCGITRDGGYCLLLDGEHSLCGFEGALADLLVDFNLVLFFPQRFMENIFFGLLTRHLRSPFFCELISFLILLATQSPGRGEKSEHRTG